MARIDLSPIVSNISGKTGGTVFSRWHGRNYIRRLVIPFNPQSVAQTAQRDAMARSVILWRWLVTWLKTWQNSFAVGIRMSGYNWFVGQNVTPEVLYDTGKLSPHNPLSVVVQDFAAAAGGAGEIDVTWTDPALANVTLCQVFYRKVETASEVDRFTLDSATAIATETVTVTGLDTGENYRIVAIYTNADQTIVGESDSGESLAG